MTFCHNDPALYAKLIAGLEKLAAADAFIKGVYWENGKGCSVGCALKTLGAPNKGKYADLAARLGTSEELQRLNDSLFEALPDHLSKEWPLRFSRAGWDDRAGKGRDLALVAAKFKHATLARLLADDLAGSDTQTVCQPILDGLAVLARGDALTDEQIAAGVTSADAASAAWGAWATSVAWSAWSASSTWSASATRSARAARAARVAWGAWGARGAWAANAAESAWGASAAWAAPAAEAAWAAWSVEARWAGSAARAEEAVRQADDLIALMEASPSDDTMTDTPTITARDAVVCVEFRSEIVSGIVRRIAIEHGVPSSDVFGWSRRPKVVRARDAVILAMAREHNMTDAEIARQLGMNATSVWAALNRNTKRQRSRDGYVPQFKGEK